MQKQSKEKYIAEEKQRLLKALSHLKYSYQKVQKLPSDIKKMDEETLEAWEGFASRFARSADIFLDKYLRALILYDDPGFRGTFRDLLDWAEKSNYIAAVSPWLEIREARNISAHVYLEEKLGQHFQKLLQYAPNLLNLIKQLK